MAASVQMTLVHSAVRRLADTLESIYIDFLDGLDCVSASAHRRPSRLLFPTGTYAAAAWMPGDDVRLVCMSDERRSIFWNCFSYLLDYDDPIRPPKDSIFQLPLSKLGLDQSTLAGTKIYLHHCLPPGKLDVAAMFGLGIPSYETSLPPRVSEQLHNTSGHRTPEEMAQLYCKEGKRLNDMPIGRHLAMVRDAEIMTSKRDSVYSLRNTGKWDDFHAAYLQLRLWAEANGILGTHLGLLDAEGLLWLVHNAFFRYIESEEVAAMMGTDMPRPEFPEVFFRDRGAFIDEKATCLSIPTPTRKSLAEHVSGEGTWTLVDAIESMQTAAFRQKTTMGSPKTMTREAGYQAFIERSNFIITIDVVPWGPNNQRRRDMLEVQLPRLVKILASRVNRRNGIFRSRLWPFSTAGAASEHVTYAIGIRERAVVDEGEIGTVKGELLEEIQQFDEKLEDCRKGAAITLELQPRLGFQRRHLSTAATAAMVDGKEGSPQSPWPRKADSLAAEKVHSKFRTAASVLSRLRWDPAHSHTQYEVGYIDRFAGLVWMALDTWGGKQTEDEDFIPEHRIRQFRKASDGKVVWDREERLDLTDEVG